MNKEELATTPLRRNALEILEAGLEAVNTEKILRKKLRIENNNLIIQNGNTTESMMVPLPLSGGGVRGEGEGKIIFVGIGKCALDGAKVIEDILGDYLTQGIVIDVKPETEASDLKKIKYFTGTHPYPSEQNVEATKEILEMVESVTEKDLVITLISGGGSSLFELPTSPLETLIGITKELTRKGADIYELNTVRKHLSQVKGGKFARLCFPARVVSLIFSDVLGNDISMVASGPTVIDTTTFKDAKKILEKYGISLPFLSLSQGGELGAGSGFEKVKNILVVSNHDALVAMKNKAEELGFSAVIETETLSGNAREIGKELALREPKPGTCILFGGETTVKIVEDHGMGGRNQEMALSALSYIKSGSVLICAASDGHDNTDYAGAIVDSELFEKAKNLNLSPEEYLEKSDSYNFFKKISGGIYTEKIGNNVSDLCIMLHK